MHAGQTVDAVVMVLLTPDNRAGYNVTVGATGYLSFPKDALEASLDERPVAAQIQERAREQGLGA